MIRARSVALWLAMALVAGAGSSVEAQVTSSQTDAALAAASEYASPHGPLSTDLDCESCHDANGWKVERAEFDHARSGFALEGRHAGIRCAACHLDLRFDEPKIAAGDCASCHVDVHQGSLGLECQSCHDTESFEARSAPDVHARTTFPLTGAHLLVHCESCHIDDRRARFDALDTDCYSCHRPDYENSRAVDHVALGYSTQCLECHNTVAWFNRVRVPPPLARFLRRQEGSR